MQGAGVFGGGSGGAAEPKHMNCAATASLPRAAGHAGAAWSRLTPPRIRAGSNRSDCDSARLFRRLRLEAGKVVLGDRDLLAGRIIEDPKRGLLQHLTLFGDVTDPDPTVGANRLRMHSFIEKALRRQRRDDPIETKAVLLPEDRVLFVAPRNPDGANKCPVDGSSKPSNASDIRPISTLLKSARPAGFFPPASISGADRSQPPYSSPASL